LWSSEVERTAAMDAMDAYEITQMLQGVVNYGTGRAVRDAGITSPVAGKTGTTNSGEDVWFVGYTPTLVAGIWFGYDQPKTIAYNASGGRLAAPAWAEMYQAGWHEPRTSAFVAPQGMVAAMVDPQSGGLATEWCPTRQRQWFKPGKEPQGECQVHRGPPEGQIAIDANGNVQAQPDIVTRMGRDLGKILRRIIRW
jgi:penicillin-binding protein 1A